MNLSLSAPDPTPPAWDATILAVESDPLWRRKYRRLQSWYRETVLGAPPGHNARGRVVGSLLPTSVVDDRPGLNFLTDEIAAYAARLASEVLQDGGTLDADRLARNMLSSMPLCFNLLGALRDAPEAAARGLSEVLGLDVAKIVRIEVEWAPDPSMHLQDRTAFDAFVWYRTHAGADAFLGIETKYTEPFSERIYRSDIYDRLTREPANGFRPGAEKRLVRRTTNQLWRNALLACSLRATDAFADGHVVVLACDGDETAEAAVAGLAQDLHDPTSLVRTATFEQIAAAVTHEPDLAEWASAFQRRYLDLTPVFEA